MNRGTALLATLMMSVACGSDDSGGDFSAGDAGLGGSGGGSATGGSGGAGGAGGTGASSGTGGAATGGQGGSAPGEAGAQDSGGTDAPVDASANYQKWTAYCTSCSVACKTIDCYEGWFETGVVAAYVDCRTASCSTSDDACADSAQAGNPVTSAGTALASSCQAKVASCGGAFSFPCVASFFSAVLPSIQSAYSTCLAGPCATAKSCMTAARPAACNG